MNNSSQVYPEVQTTAGKVRGFWREAPETGGVASAAFLGIPYAEPPIGELRFAAPKPHQPWEGVRDAREFGATPHREVGGEITLIPEPTFPGESTLNLNIFTPSPEKTDSGLPVLVYIHGGGYISGSPSSPWYDGQPFNREGVIVVSISYRLGFDGFGWIEDAPMNRGVLDWILALEWVQENIASFGGDPGRVTLAGQSAGGGAVLTLLGMPRAQHLFHAIYSISGVPTTMKMEQAIATGRKLADLGGVAPTVEGLRSLPEERILELQSQLAAMPSATGADDGADPLAGLVSLASEGGLAFGPVVDGELIPLPSQEAFAAGIGADKPLVLGTADEEFNMALAQAREALADVPAATALAPFGRDEQVVADYVASHPQRDTADIVGQYITDVMFRAPNLELAQARASYQARASNQEGDDAAAPTWLYRFAWASPVFGSACHCIDVPFFFDQLGSERVANIAGANPPQDLANEVHANACGLIKNHNPGWPAWNNQDRQAMVYNHPASTVESNSYADAALLIPASES